MSDKPEPSELMAAAREVRDQALECLNRPAEFQGGFVNACNQHGLDLALGYLALTAENARQRAKLIEVAAIIEEKRRVESRVKELEAK